MGKRSTVLIVLAALALSAPALAQTPAPAAAPLLESPAAARAAANDLIALAHVSDLFENVTEGSEPVLRHRASGLKCSFGVAPTVWRQDAILVFQTGLPRGDDVGCNMHFERYLVSLDVSRLAKTPTLDAMTAYYAKSALAAHPKANAYAGPYVQPQGLPSDFPLFHIVRFAFDDPAGRQFSLLGVAVVNGWVIEERVTGPYDDARFGDLLGAGELVAAINNVHGGDLLKRP
jgi:hypothetical protein